MNYKTKNLSIWKSIFILFLIFCGLISGSKMFYVFFMVISIYAFFKYFSVSIIASFLISPLVYYIYKNVSISDITGVNIKLMLFVYDKFMSEGFYEVF